VVDETTVMELVGPVHAALTVAALMGDGAAEMYLAAAAYM
jgi:hypothetical protein